MIQCLLALFYLRYGHSVAIQLPPIIGRTSVTVNREEKLTDRRHGG